VWWRLQVIPKEYAEAAEVFGASALQRLRYVTLPLLSPSLQVALILRTILGLSGVRGGDRAQRRSNSRFVY